MNVVLEGDGEWLVGIGEHLRPVLGCEAGIVVGFPGVFFRMEKGFVEGVVGVDVWLP